MKTIKFTCTGPVKAFILITLLGLPNWLSAQNYRLDWFSIDGGGGTSTGGVYSVSGSIGQSDAGAMSGGSYSLIGGFWSAIAVIPVSGAPELTIIPTTGNQVILFWPNPSTGFVLQQAGDASAAATWTEVSTLPTVVADNQQVMVSLSPGRRFYRLFKP